jgi:predicted transposase/invertase (TIGR01784 family)
MKQKLIRFDWALKRLLRNKANYDILEGFLSELLKEDIKIQSILESESNKVKREDKYNRVDLLVENSKKELIIIEIQSTSEFDYLQRLLYGASKLLVENIQKGMSYSEIKKIISVSIVYFNLGQGEDYIYEGKTHFIGLHKKDELKLSETQKELYKTDQISKIYPEYYILKINQFNDVAKDTLDEWIYFLKNEEIKDGFKAKGLEKARKELSILELSEEERKEYDSYQEYLHYEASMIESSYGLGKMEGHKEGKQEGIKEGREEGIKEGIEKGMEKGIENAVIKLFEKGITKEKISELLELDIDIVEKAIKTD